MKKRKIDPGYLRQLLSPSIKEQVISVQEFTSTARIFADEYLQGMLRVAVNGGCDGTVRLNLSAVSYLVRLLCELAEDDEVIDLIFDLGDNMTMSASFRDMSNHEDVAHIIKVARLANFDVTRDGNTLIFSADVTVSPIMKIYAVSSDDFMQILILTHKM